MKKRLKQIVILFLVWFTVHEIVIISDGLSDEVNNADYIVVLGTKVNEDGTLSERLKARVNKAFELYNSGKGKKLFVSGGLGKEGHFEGSKMAEYLLQSGVDSSDVIVDNLGNTTRLTALNFSKVANDYSSVIVVSQYFHISRCKLAMKQVGFEHVYGAHANHFELRDPYSAFREFLGYYKYLIWY